MCELCGTLGRGRGVLEEGLGKKGEKHNEGLYKDAFRERGYETVWGYRLLELLMVSHKKSI